MKLKSKNPNATGEFFSMVLPFERGFIKKVRLVAGDVLSFVYDASFSSASTSGYRKEVLLLVGVDSDGLNAQASIFVADEKNCQCSDFADEWGTIDCDVKFEKNELEQLLLFMMQIFLGHNNTYLN